MNTDDYHSAVRDPIRMNTSTGGRSSLGAIMLSWNQKDMTLEGLAALHRLDEPRPHILLVDNGSTDGTVEAVRAAYPGVDVLALPENLGFCAANNRGAERMLANPAIDSVIFLNNDIDLEPDCLNRLTAFMDTHSQAGACGPLMFYFEPRDAIWAAGGAVFPDLMWFPPHLKNRPDPGLRRPRQVDYIHGCALLVRRRVIEELGMFDERFFIYHDEVDWCLRMRRAGYSVWLVPTAHLYHKVTQAVGQHSPMMIYYTARNKLLFWWKHGRVVDLPKFYAFHLLKAVRILSRNRSLWSFVALGKALIDALGGWFGRGHIQRARK